MSAPTKRDMEAYRLAKKVTCLAKAEGRALLAIADACSMRDGECRKSLTTLANEHKDSVRQLKYGIHGRLRSDSTEYYPGLLRRRIITVKSSRDGVPTAYVINLDVLKALVYGRTSAQSDAQTSAQNEVDPCTNEREPVHNRAETSALMPPSSLEVPKDSSYLPTSQPGKKAGGVDLGSPEQISQEEATEDAVLDRLEKVHDVLWDKRCGEDWDWIDFPAALPLAGKDRLLKVLRTYSSSYTDVSVFLRDVEGGFYLWWLTRYAPSFLVAAQAAQVDAATGTKSKVPRPIHTPLAIFAKECERYLRKAREQRELEADDEPVLVKASVGAKPTGDHYVSPASPEG